MVVELSGALLSTGCMYSAPPLSFLLLIQPDNAKVQEALADHRRAWGSLEKLEHVAVHNDDRKAFVDGCLVGLIQWCREIFLLLLEVDFSRVPKRVEQHAISFLSFSHSNFSLFQSLSISLSLSFSLSLSLSVSLSVSHSLCLSLSLSVSLTLSLSLSLFPFVSLFLHIPTLSRTLSLSLSLSSSPLSTSLFVSHLLFFCSCPCFSLHIPSTLVSIVSHIAFSCLHPTHHAQASGWCFGLEVVWSYNPKMFRIRNKG